MGMGIAVIPWISVVICWNGDSGNIMDFYGNLREWDRGNTVDICGNLREWE